MRDDGRPRKRSGSGNKTMIMAAKTVPGSEASPPMMTMTKIGIRLAKAKEVGSM